MSTTKFLLVIQLFTLLKIQGQSNNRFYKTLEDYYNNIPIKGIEIIRGSIKDGNSKNAMVSIKKDSAVSIIKLSDAPSQLFTYDFTLLATENFKSDSAKKNAFYPLVIFSNNNCYYVLNHGDTILFVAQYDADITKPDKSSDYNVRLHKRQNTTSTYDGEKWKNGGGPVTYSSSFNYYISTEKLLLPKKIKIKKIKQIFQAKGVLNSFEQEYKTATQNISNQSTLIKKELNLILKYL